MPGNPNSAAALAEDTRRRQALKLAASKYVGVGCNVGDVIIGVVGEFDIQGTINDFNRLLTLLGNPSMRPITVKVLDKSIAAGWRGGGEGAPDVGVRLLRFGLGRLGTTLSWVEDGHKVQVTAVDRAQMTAICTDVTNEGKEETTTTGEVDKRKEEQREAC